MVAVGEGVAAEELMDVRNSLTECYIYNCTSIDDQEIKGISSREKVTFLKIYGLIQGLLLTGAF